MFGKQPKLGDSVAALIAPGEDVLAAVAVQPKGSGNSRAIGGVVGGMIGSRGSKTTRESKALTGIEIPKWAALAVTPQRLLILKMNGMGSKASEIISEVPIGDVDSIEVSKSALRKQVTLTALGATFEFECHKGTAAESLSDALAQARG